MKIIDTDILDANKVKVLNAPGRIIINAQNPTVDFSPDMVRLVLRELQKENVLSCEGRGPGALWRKKGNLPKKG
jgi:hypothetical protein